MKKPYLEALSLMNVLEFRTKEQTFRMKLSDCCRKEYKIVEDTLNHVDYLEERVKHLEKQYSHALGVIDDITEGRIKNDRAIEIIKNKKVDVTRLYTAFERNDLSFYNYYCYEQLTQEEYDLLKEVLK